MRVRDRLAVGLAAGLTAAAVRQELQQPPGKRAWHGRVGGVPYDFRPPDARRVRSSVFNPEDPRLLTEHPLGIGWTLNLGRFAAPQTRAGRRARRKTERRARRTIKSG